MNIVKELVTLKDGMDVFLGTRRSQAAISRTVCMPIRTILLGMLTGREIFDVTPSITMVGIIIYTVHISPVLQKRRSNA